MAGESGSRPLLPQSSQGQAFPFVNAAPQREPQQRNYVFVDEHNRHKRLKVMRACEGCRRRKIKCDAATTNSWPCAACTRLKLTCIPPTVSYEKDSSTPGVHTFELQQNSPYPTISVGNIGEYQHHQLHQYSPGPSSISQPLPGQYPDVQTFQNATFVPAQPSQEPIHQYEQIPSTSPPHGLGMPPAYPLPPNIPPPPGSERSWGSESGMSGLTDVLGDLQIDAVATAPYISDQRKLAEVPAVEEFEMNLPNLTSPDMRVRIPPEMMPSDQQALQYFDYFFANIHPFAPVLHKETFYNDWHSNRDAISPLLLEAIFACSSAMLETHPEGNKWLALAAKHEESFKDVPRLSTIQAQCLLLKARESYPKRGYFYRSWMIVVNMVAMSKDLGLQQHLEDHEDGRPCGYSPVECVCRTRIWQLLFILESMVGGPQGRVDYGILPETVDFKEPTPIQGIEESEFQLSRQFVYFARVVRNIRETVRIYAKLRRKRDDWSLDTENLSHNDSYVSWLREVPQDLQVVFQDSTQPWIPSPFIGNLHCYEYLSIIMHHRPQIHYLMDHDNEASWKPNMMLCLDAAQKMCRIQEAMLATTGLPSLMCMQRGMSFTIYCVLTCTMLHLVAITSPDPDLNCNARDYFVRHMRILEQCIPIWPMPEMKMQIDTLRQAFSADTSKPFELKPGFPFGSPPPQPQEVGPLPDIKYTTAPASPENILVPSGQMAYNIIHPITPPVSTTDDETSANSPSNQSLGMMANQHQAGMATLQPQAHHWNPTRIFDQWNMAFNTPPPSNAAGQSSPSMSNVPSTADYDLRQGQEGLPPNPYSPQAYSPQGGNQMQMPAQVVSPTSHPTPGPAFVVSPSVWQEVVASSFGDPAALQRQQGWRGQG